MKINGWDVAQANGQQWTVDHSAKYVIKSNSVWNEGAPAPLLSPSYIGNKTVKITLRVTGRTREEAVYNCSRIAGMCVGIVDIELDNSVFRVKGNVTNITHKDFNDGKTSHRLTLDVEGYMYSEEVSDHFSNTMSHEIVNNGTVGTPAILEIRANSGAVDLTISGFGRDVVIRNVAKNDLIVIDGEKGIATKNGQTSSDIEIWKMPLLQPGSNAVSVSSAWMDVTVKYKPRYL